MIPISNHERFFLSVVNALGGVIGYGRMMQIVSHAWYRIDRDGAFISGTCYALLPKRKQATYRAIAEGDPLFQEEK